jgi:hypothetical protein
MTGRNTRGKKRQHKRSDAAKKDGKNLLDINLLPKSSASPRHCGFGLEILFYAATSLRENMKLSIDASDQSVVKLGLTLNNKQVTHVFETNQNLSERLIPEIQKFLRKKKIKLVQIRKIEVMAGPGPFSRIRTAVATANALAYALNLKQPRVKPIYSQGPNITKPR